MKLRTTTLLALLTVFSISLSHAETIRPDVIDFVKQYPTEAEYQQAYKDAKQAYSDRYLSYYMNKPEYLKANRINFCNSTEDSYHLYDLTVLNQQYPSARQDKLDEKTERQTKFSGQDREVLKVSCYPKMKILDKNDRWITPKTTYTTSRPI